MQNDQTGGDPRWTFPRPRATNAIIEKANAGPAGMAWATLSAHARFQEMQVLALQAQLRQSRGLIIEAQELYASAGMTDKVQAHDRALRSLSDTLGIISSFDDRFIERQVVDGLNGGKPLAETFRQYLNAWFLSEPPGQHLMRALKIGQTIIGQSMESGFVYEGELAFLNSAATGELASEFRALIEDEQWGELDERLTLLARVMVHHTYKSRPVRLVGDDT